MFHQMILMLSTHTFLDINHEEYKNIYIPADMTKYQRSRHKKLVEELKHGKAAKEPI